MVGGCLFSDRTNNHKQPRPSDCFFLDALISLAWEAAPSLVMQNLKEDWQHSVRILVAVAADGGIASAVCNKLRCLMAMENS